MVKDCCSQFAFSVAGAWFTAAVSVATTVTVSDQTNLQLNILVGLSVFLFPVLAFIGYQTVLYRSERPG